MTQDITLTLDGNLIHKADALVSKIVQLDTESPYER